MNWWESYTPNYYSIDDILATQERITCRVELPVYGLGYLDQSSGSSDLDVGSKLELPYWLAKALSTSRRHIVSTQLPSAFKEKYREMLSADPCVVNLHKLGPYFYEFGQHLLVLAGNQAPDIYSLLVQTLRGRLRDIMDASQNSLADDSSKQIILLDELERLLFRVGQTTLRDHELWLSRKSHILRVSSIVEKSNKRKLALCS